MLCVCNGIVKEGCIPEDSKSSVVLPIYKGDPMKCGSYRGIKLLEHAMKVVERIFEYRIWQQTDTDDMQFGFMKGKGTTDTIYIVRQIQEFTDKGKQMSAYHVTSKIAIPESPWSARVNSSTILIDEFTKSQLNMANS